MTEVRDCEKDSSCQINYRRAWCGTSERACSPSADELYQIANSIVSVPGRDLSELDTTDQESCFEFISAFMHSTQLLESEDKGITKPFILHKTVNSIEQVRTIAAPVFQCNDVEANVNVDARIIPTTQTSIATDHITTTNTVYPTSPTAGTGGIRVVKLVKIKHLSSSYTGS